MKPFCWGAVTEANGIGLPRRWTQQPQSWASAHGVKSGSIWHLTPKPLMTHLAPGPGRRRDLRGSTQPLLFQWSVNVRRPCVSSGQQRLILIFVQQLLTICEPHNPKLRSFSLAPNNPNMRWLLRFVAFRRKPIFCATEAMGAGEVYDVGEGSSDQEGRCLLVGSLGRSWKRAMGRHTCHSLSNLNRAESSYCCRVLCYS